LGLEIPNLGLDPGETFFPNSVSVLDSAETFQISRNPGLDVDENVCLLDSQPWVKYYDESYKGHAILPAVTGAAQQPSIFHSQSFS
jgi:hypothetical protein